jgi:hypothetical protein
MAWTAGQTIGLTEGAVVSSKSASFGTLPSAGSVIVVPISAYDNTPNDTHGISSVTDNQGNTYHRAVERLIGAAGSQTSAPNAWASIWYSDPIGTPSGTFTLTVTGNDPTNNYLTFGVVEAKPDAANTTALGPTNSGAGTTAGTTASATPGSITTTQPNAFEAAVYVTTSNVGSFSGPSGYTSLFREISAATFEPGDGYYKIRTTTGTDTPGNTITWTLASNDWGAAQAAVQESVAAYNPALFPHLLTPAQRQERTSAVAY